MYIINRVKKQSGDTIVEVMIAIAIISLAIAIAYSISGKNLNVGITARERNSALGLVQGQIESMKAVYQTSPTSLNAYKDQLKHFCFDPTTYAVLDNANGINSDNSLGSPNNDSNKYPHCQSGGYYLDVNYVPYSPNSGPSKASGNSFMFTARWFKVGGGVDQIVTIYYRPW